MRISLISHACLLIEVDGIRIISDPWWSGPCFGAEWWNYPKPALEPLSERAVDFIYISHGHHDHYHPGTLKSFNRDVKLLVAANTNLGRPIRDLGFQVVEVSDEEEFRLSDNATCRIRETYAGDTFLAVSDSKEVCVNLNDALHSAPHEIRERHIASLTALYPSIDYVFCGILCLPFSAEEVKGAYHDSIDRANRHTEVDNRSVQAVASLLSANLETCNAYLKSYAGEYRVLVDFYRMGGTIIG